MIFHTGMRRLLLVGRGSGEKLFPVARLRYAALSHFESDECGALNAFLAVAPHALPVCGTIAAMVSINDFATRPPHVLADGAELDLGRHRMRWFDAAHVPHAWECGLMLDTVSK